MDFFPIVNIETAQKYAMQAIITTDYDRRLTHFEMKTKNCEPIRHGVSYL